MFVRVVGRESLGGEGAGEEVGGGDSAGGDRVGRHLSRPAALLSCPAASSKPNHQHNPCTLATLSAAFINSVFL